MSSTGIDFAAVPRTALRVLLNPIAFFREMPKTGGYLEPLLFMVVMGVIGGLIQSVLAVLGLQFGAGVAMGVGAVIVLPLLIAAFGFVGAAILYVIWKLLGSRESFETAYRCSAYISALTPVTTVLGIIPYAGAAVSVVLATYFIVIASILVHDIPSGRAWLVFGIIGVLLIVLNVSGQFAARRMAGEAEKFQKQMQDATKAIEKQTTEMQKQAEEARKAAEEMQKQLEQMQRK